MAAINLIKQLAATSKVLVITTIDVASPWLKEISDYNNVVCLESKEFFRNIDDDRRINFILKIIQHWGVKRLSIINSELGYKIVTKFDRVLKDVGCRSFLHTYAYDMTEDGYIFNVIPNGLVDAYQGVDYIVTDSLAYKLQLEEVNGFDAAKVFKLYLPVSTNIKPKSDYALKQKVVWASRIHNSKLIEVAVDVAKQLKPAGIELHMYGAIDEEYAREDKFTRMIESVDNLVYHGSYDGFGSIDMNEYDLFLMTSKNEGMPNVILEAAMADIFIVAPAVGGISESISHGTNGLLVSNKFDPTAYVAAIKEAYANGYTQSQAVMNIQNKKLLKRHSTAAYQKSLTELMG